MSPYYDNRGCRGRDVRRRVQAGKTTLAILASMIAVIAWVKAPGTRSASARLVSHRARSALSVRGALALYYKQKLGRAGVTVRGYYVPVVTNGPPPGNPYQTGYLFDQKVSGVIAASADLGLVVYGPKWATTAPGPSGGRLPEFTWVYVRGRFDPHGAVARHSREGRPLLWETSWTYAPTARKAR